MVDFNKLAIELDSLCIDVSIEDSAWYDNVKLKSIKVYTPNGYSTKEPCYPNAISGEEDFGHILKSRELLQEDLLSRFPNLVSWYEDNNPNDLTWNSLKDTSSVQEVEVKNVIQAFDSVHSGIPITTYTKNSSYKTFYTKYLPNNSEFNLYEHLINVDTKESNNMSDSLRSITSLDLQHAWDSSGAEYVIEVVTLLDILGLSYTAFTDEYKVCVIKKFPSGVSTEEGKTYLLTPNTLNSDGTAFPSLFCCVLPDFIGFIEYDKDNSLLTFGGNNINYTVLGWPIEDKVGGIKETTITIPYTPPVYSTSIQELMQEYNLSIDSLGKLIDIYRNCIKQSGSFFTALDSYLKITGKIEKFPKQKSLILYPYDLIDPSTNKKVDIENTLLIVEAETVGYPSEDCPCGKDKSKETKAVYNKKYIFDLAMRYFGTMDGGCTLDRDFIDFILKIKALDLSIEACNYLQAAKYWLLFTGLNVGNKLTSGCGCHG